MKYENMKERIDCEGEAQNRTAADRSIMSNGTLWPSRSRMLEIPYLLDQLCGRRRSERTGSS